MSRRFCILTSSTPDESQRREVIGIVNADSLPRVASGATIDCGMFLLRPMLFCRCTNFIHIPVAIALTSCKPCLIDIIYLVTY